jgi:hypothetical protein
MPSVKQILTESIARIGKADSPDVLRGRVMGEVDMAYKLDLLTFAEREHWQQNVIAACGRRRNQLHKMKLERLGIKE